ncbi:MAG: 2Fe-2S iron-sulfur cluster-binding protein [Actinomycetota bacterium]
MRLADLRRRLVRRAEPGTVEVRVEAATGEVQRGEVDAGTLLLRASRRVGVPLENLCANRALCMTCAVRIVDGHDGLTPADERERRYLDWVGAPDDVRLACQATVRGDVSVRANLIPIDRWDHDPAMPWWDDLRHDPPDREAGR